MPGAEGVVLGFGAHRKTGAAVGLAKPPELFFSAGDDFVGVCLMADVPDDLVARRVEDIMKRQHQLGHAEAGADMAAVFGTAADNEFPDFRAELFQLAGRQLPQILRGIDPVVKHFQKNPVERSCNMIYMELTASEFFFNAAAGKFIAFFRLPNAADVLYYFLCRVAGVVRTGAGEGDCGGHIRQSRIFRVVLHRNFYRR